MGKSILKPYLKYLPSILVRTILFIFFLAYTTGKALLLLALIYVASAITNVICTYGLGSQIGLLAATMVRYGSILFIVFRVTEKSGLVRLRNYLDSGCQQDFKNLHIKFPTL